MASINLEATPPSSELRGVLIDSRAIVSGVELNEAYFSSSLREGSQGVDQILKEFIVYSQREDARYDIEVVLASIDEGKVLSEGHIERLTKAALKYATPAEKGIILKALLDGVEDGRIAHVATAFMILQGVCFGRALSNAGRQQFFTPFLLAPGQSLARLALVVQTPEESRQLADSFVKSMLMGLVATVKEGALKERLSRDGVTERELIEVMRTISSGKRTTFIESLMDAVDQVPDVRRFIEAKLTNVLHFTNAQERISLLQYALQHGSPEVRDLISARILAASKSQEELSAVIDGVGQDRIMSRAGTRAKELIALSVIGTEMREAERAVSQEADLVTNFEGEILRIVGELEERAATITSHPEFSDTEVARDFLRIAQYNLEYLAKAVDYAASPEEAMDLIVFMREKCSIEFRYGVLLSDQESVDEQPGARWSYADLREARSAIERIPERVVLTTPLLGEIQRVNDLGAGVLGQRFPDGVIRISNLAVGNAMVSLIYGGTGSLEAVLVHEMGHSVQLGGLAPYIMMDRDEKLSLSADPEYDFGEFMDLAGWEIVHPDRWHFTNAGFSVMLDGEEYPIGIPVKHRGQEITLFHNQGILYVRDSYGSFSLVPYSRTNPWEDWAEAFMEYCLLPERLIQFAPKKFEFLEQEFRLYEDRADLLEAVAKRSQLWDQVYGDGRV